MHRVMSCVKEFYESFGLPVITDTPHLPDEERRKLRMKLLEEEYHEYRYAERGHDLIKVADALADMVYVIAGTALEYGIPLDKVFLEIHKSNMSKLVDGKPILREDGKVLKTPGYHRPDVAGILCDKVYGEVDV